MGTRRPQRVTPAYFGNAVSRLMVSPGTTRALLAIAMLFCRLRKENGKRFLAVTKGSRTRGSSSRGSSRQSHAASTFSTCYRSARKRALAHLFPYRRKSVRRLAS